MVANIFGSRFESARRPAWHGIGKVFTDDPGAVEAVKRSHNDFVVHTTPLTLPLTFKGKDYTVDTGKVAIIREPVADDPEPAFFGLAGPNYTPIQNLTLGEVLDTLIEQTHWTVETVGSLGRGERFFITLDAGSASVGPKGKGGDEVRRYFLLTNGHTGGHACQAAFTPVRVVCENTLSTGLAAATLAVAIPHRKNVRDELQFRVDLIGHMEKAQDTVLQVLNRLTEVTLTTDQVMTIIAAAYAYPPDPAKVRFANDLKEAGRFETLDESKRNDLQATVDNWDYYIGRLNAYREGARSLFERINDEYPAIANTAYAAWNAVVECSDYRQGSDKVDESAVFGPRAKEKQRAFAATLQAASIRQKVAVPA